MERKTLTSYICVIFAATCWGTTGMANRFLTPLGLSQTQILFIRVFLAAVFLGAFLLVRDRGAFRIHWKDLWLFFGTGVCSLMFFGISYFNAMQEMTLSIAVVLLYTAPIFVVILSAILFKERITAVKVLALALIILGALCTTGLIQGGGAVSVRGLLFGICSGLGYALYSIFSRYALNRGYSSLAISFYTMVFASLGTAFIADLPGLAQVAFTDGHGLFWELYMGLVTCALPYIFYTRGLEGLENGPASIAASWEMVMATLCSVIIFHEPLGWLAALGIVLVLGGIVAMNVRSGSKPVPHN